MKTRKLKWLSGIIAILLGINLNATTSYPVPTSKTTAQPVKGFTFKGDLRVRYQWEKKKESNSRERERIRLRLGFKTEKIKNFTIGAGIATGNGDPRSTNITLTKSFSMKNIQLNYAYAAYHGIPHLNLWAGKYSGIKKVIWTTSDLIWDSDLTPEGAGLKGEYSMGHTSIFTNAGFWIIKERKKGADPGITYIQLGGKLSVRKILLSAGISYFDSHSVKDYQLPFTSGTNSHTPDGKLIYDYNTIEANLQLNAKNVLPEIPCISLFGTYVKNLAVSENSTGYLTGLKLGYRKLRKENNWQIKLMYRYLEKDAWLDIFPDSDAYGGETGVQGYEAEGKFLLTKGLTLGIDYYLMKPINGTNIQNLIQLDLIWKF